MSDAKIKLKLTTPEAERLKVCEGIIQQKMVDFLEVGTALLEIRDDKLYRNSHDTFEKYCHEKWSISRSRAYQLTNAVEVVKNLEMSTMVDKKNPINTSELKPERIIQMKTEKPTVEEALQDLNDIRSELAAMRTIQDYCKYLSQRPDVDRIYPFPMG